VDETMTARPVADIAAVLAAETPREYLADALGPGQGVYIQPYSTASLESWQQYAKRRAGKDAEPEALMAWINLAEVVGCVVDAEGRRLLDDKSGAALKGKLPAASWARLVVAIDRLSGFGEETLRRLAEAGVPTRGSGSDSGVSTDSADSPESAEAS